MSLPSFITNLRSHPVGTGLFGTVTGWASFDLLRAAQIFAGLTAGLVSLGTLIIIAPKVWSQLKSWYAALRGDSDL